jgi:hypothetical protein
MKVSNKNFYNLTNNEREILLCYINSVPTDNLKTQENYYGSKFDCLEYYENLCDVADSLLKGLLISDKYLKMCEEYEKILTKIENIKKDYDDMILNQLSLITLKIINKYK